ncbi:diguanylate cyclase [Oceanimonas baumannii]|uniref:diguanylate cyclase domain-containing protein n=1 Tax=Oceanimonas baumannii TaxID=129578 RepID=UPI001D192B96|nr:diguanylate cyclase [Oceanimonas baumannii]MCC4263507.1 diguanylate cyclase [Oceanimonas baumannii]
MRTQKKKEEISGEMTGAHNSNSDEWRRLCTGAAAIAGARRACFVFLGHHASVVATVLGQPFKGWQDQHSLALWRQQRFYCPLTSHELQLDGSGGYLAVPVMRKHIRGLLLLEFDVPEPSLTVTLREQLELLAEHGALLWQEKELETQWQDEDISSGRFINRLKSLFLRVPVLINGFDTAGRCILWNNECERVFGWSFEELKLQAAPIALFYPDAEERQRVIGTFREMHGTEFREWHPVARNGHRLTTLWANIMLPNGDMICVGHDITEQRALEVQQQLAASVFEASYDGIMLTDADNRVLTVNPSFTRITGYTQEDVAGHISTLFRHEAGAGPQLPADAQSPDHWQGECVIRRRNNTECHLLLSVSVIRDQQGSVQHHALILTDISHIKQHEAELRQRALYDSLTGIPNRQLFSELLDRALAAATRNGTMVAVCYLDLDGFKQINDTLGHAAGDKLLVEVAGRMALLLRSTDAVARLGGDEFALMITGLHHALECTDILERMLSAINAPFNPGSHQIRVSASIGVAVYPEDSREGESLLCYADQAMYDAKKQGKSRYVFFEPALHSED